MVGTILNAAGIVIGGVAGLTARKPPSPASQNFFKVALGTAAAFYGLRLVWLGINGSFGQCAKQFGVTLLALIAGRLVGRLLRLQKMSNHLGHYARERINHAIRSHSPRWSDGFNTCAVLYCAAPLAVLGAVAEGLSQPEGSFSAFQPLLIKAVMDGLATMGFVAMFGWSVVFAALPVFVYQGTITMLCAQYAQPFLEQHALLDSVNATDGWLIVFVALVIFEVRKIELADYLPSLFFAPLLTWWLLR